MDMSVKLGLSYPALNTAEPPSGKAQELKRTDTPADETPKQADRDALDQAVQAIQAFVKAAERQLEFSIDDSTGQVVVKVIARQSGEVIRQLPSEAALKLAQNLNDASSLLFATKV
ncbi:flagellar protein FlaG [Pseudomonas sp. JQ170]|uniref:flagellar protein FlaG n=1 Tax=unclassified Pseudomonas TaxID=196821 RepID=UPI00264FA0B0|nr:MULTISPECIES: flagellar protein FlaG [unclassified Pseudomonas]MDN7139146.1 flagellar protein FlaG [Pseudomonas sp. JQ170]WRO77531.1 flagellar protein FlaG [Pseudomonas sp. 170C]